MSSLRPLITITLLAFVGVLLYMKINETEPVLPDELAGQEIALELEVGGDGATAAAAPELPPATLGGTAPSATSPAAPVSAQTPAWSPKPLVVNETAPKFDAAATAIAVKPAVGAVPPMPPLPGAANPATPATSAATTSAPTTPTPNAPPSTNAVTAKTAAIGAPAGAASLAAATQAAPPITPTPHSPDATGASTDGAASMFAAARIAVQGALDRGELAQALQLLSDWYGDPSLTPAETQYVENLLGQLAGSVIYEGPPAHRLESPYIVQAGETLEDVARRYDIPAALLAKINGIADPKSLHSGQELKVVRGPFSALIDLSERRMTLMLDRRYAGRFPLQLDPDVSVEEGSWKVDQKLLTPAAAGLYGQQPGAASEDRSLLLTNPANPAAQAAVLRGAANKDPLAAEPRGRVLRLDGADVAEVFDILSVGSRITIRR